MAIIRYVEPIVIILEKEMATTKEIVIEYTQKGIKKEFKHFTTKK